MSLLVAGLDAAKDGRGKEGDHQVIEVNGQSPVGVTSTQAAIVL